MSQTPEQTDANAATVKLIESVFAAWANQADTLVELFTDDVVYEDVPFGAVNRSKDELKAFANGFFGAFPDVHFTIDSLHVDDAHAHAEWSFTGTQTGDLPGLPATGGKVHVRGASIIQIRGDKVCKQTDYWDFAGMQQQLAATPA